MTWRDHAACKGQGPDRFFPAPTDRRAVNAAREICTGCLVRIECCTFATREHIVDGVWGGQLLTIARDRTQRGLGPRRTRGSSPSKTLTPSEREQLVAQGLIEEEGVA